MTKPFHMAWGSIAHRIGRRGAFLAFLAILHYAFAWQFWFIGAQGMPTIAPVRVWAIGWLVSAIGCTVGIVLRRDRISYTLAATMNGCLAALYSYLWLVKNAPYGWVNALFWSVFALIVVMVSSWPDPILAESVKRRQG